MASSGLLVGTHLCLRARPKVPHVLSRIVNVPVIGYHIWIALWEFLSNTARFSSALELFAGDWSWMVLLAERWKDPFMGTIDEAKDQAQ